jgi:large subunit ribosomal protein L1
MAAEALKEKRSKRYQKRAALVDRTRSYSIAEAVKVLKQITEARYDETVALNFQLGIQPDQADQLVRGTVSLPHGTGQKVRVICFCKGEGAQAAEKAGADAVGAEELVQKIQGGWLEFDAVVAHPDMMREVSKLGKVLGPKGLMPSPKSGTVTPDVERAVKELKAGRIEFKADKTGGLHAPCGKLSFSEPALEENVTALVRAIRDAKPQAAKGNYLKRVTLSLSQGPGIALAVSSL